MMGICPIEPSSRSLAEMADHLLFNDAMIKLLQYIYEGLLQLKKFNVIIEKKI